MQRRIFLKGLSATALAPSALAVLTGCGGGGGSDGESSATLLQTDQASKSLGEK